jgi:hypothetical protein
MKCYGPKSIFSSATRRNGFPHRRKSGVPLRRHDGPKITHLRRNEAANADNSNAKLRFLAKERFFFVVDRAVRGIQRGLDSDNSLRVSFVAIAGTVSLHQTTPLLDQLCTRTP